MTRERETRDRETRDRESRDRETRDRETRDRETRDQETGNVWAKAEASEQMGPSALLIRKLSTSELAEVKTLTISGKYHSTVVARNILMDIVEFNRYNPHFDKLIASADNSYDLKLPPGKMDLFTANKYQILNESVQLLLSGDMATSAAGSK